MEWLAYLELEVNDFHREDAYLAQIAAEIRRPNVKNPADVKTDDFILKFEEVKEKDKVKVPTPVPVVTDLRKAKTDLAKARWRIGLGLAPEDTAETKPKFNRAEVIKQLQRKGGK